MQITNARGQKRSDTYDAVGNLSRLTYPDNTAVRMNMNCEIGDIVEIISDENT